MATLLEEFQTLILEKDGADKSMFLNRFQNSSKADLQEFFDFESNVPPHSSMFHVALNYDFEVATLFLEHNRSSHPELFDVNHPDSLGFTPLARAIEFDKGRIATAKLLKLSEYGLNIGDANLTSLLGNDQQMNLFKEGFHSFLTSIDDDDERGHCETVLRRALKAEAPLQAIPEEVLVLAAGSAVHAAPLLSRGDGGDRGH
jgi:hypothetical protein